MGPKLIASNLEIESKIYHLRNKKVMLDSDLAALYGVETKRLNEQVKRNRNRFPDHFMFEITSKEYDSIRSQNATLKQGEHIKYLPFGFTEHGVLMLSNVLRSGYAIEMSIKIIEVFVKQREMLQTNSDILLKLEKIESAVGNHDTEIKTIFNYLKRLVQQPAKQIAPRKRIGFKSDEL